MKEYIGTPCPGDKLLDPNCMKCGHPVVDHETIGDEWDAYYACCYFCDCSNCTARIKP